MERREFIRYTGASAGVVAGLPALIAACSPQETAESEETTASAPSEAAVQAEAESPAAEEASADGFVTVGTVAELEENGYLTNQDAKVIVLQAEDSLTALTLICPHRDCLVDWQPDDNLFECPCHASEFGPDGSLITGPAEEALAAYEVKEENGSILVKVG